MATDALDDWRCLYDPAFWAVGDHHLMDVCDTKRAVTDGGCKSVDDELLSFTQESLSALVFQVAEHIIKAGAHVTLLDDSVYEVPIPLHCLQVLVARHVRLRYQQYATVLLFRSSLTRIAEAQTPRPCQWRHVAVVEERLRPNPR